MKPFTIGSQKRVSTCILPSKSAIVTLFSILADQGSLKQLPESTGRYDRQQQCLHGDNPRTSLGTSSLRRISLSIDVASEMVRESFEVDVPFASAKIKLIPVFIGLACG